MDSILSPQTILTMHDKLTMAMLLAGVKNNQDYDSCNFLFCLLFKSIIFCLDTFRYRMTFNVPAIPF